MELREQLLSWTGIVTELEMWKATEHSELKLLNEMAAALGFENGRRLSFLLNVSQTLSSCLISTFEVGYKKERNKLLLSTLLRKLEAHLMKGMIIKKLFALFPSVCLEVRSFLCRGRPSTRNH